MKDFRSNLTEEQHVFIKHLKYLRDGPLLEPHKQLYHTFHTHVWFKHHFTMFCQIKPRWNCVLWFGGHHSDGNFTLWLLLLVFSLHFRSLIGVFCQRVSFCFSLTLKELLLNPSIKTNHDKQSILRPSAVKWTIPQSPLAALIVDVFALETRADERCVKNYEVSRRSHRPRPYRKYLLTSSALPHDATSPLSPTLNKKCFCL